MTTSRDALIHPALTLLVAFAVVLSMSSPAGAQSEKRAYSGFFENSTSYRGIEARWTDEDWQAIPCPQLPNFANRVNTFVNAYGQVQPYWMQTGHKKRRTNVNGPCDTIRNYYWERNASNGYNKGTIEGFQLGTHNWQLNRRYDQCAGGVTWCWHFRIDGILTHTCCGDLFGEFTYAPEVSVEVECIWDTPNTPDCPAAGRVNPVDSLRYKNTSDLWNNWAGQDDACSDTQKAAKARWLSATSFDAGFNITMSDTITNQCT